MSKKYFSQRNALFGAKLVMWKLNCVFMLIIRSSQVALAVKNLPASAGDVGDLGSIPGSGRSPAGGHGNPLQYSCLENPMDRGGWWAAVHGVTKSQAQQKVP